MNITKTSTSIRTHGFHMDISNEGAGTSQQEKIALIIAGSGKENLPDVPEYAMNESSVNATYGAYSSAATMYKHFRKIDANTPVYILALKPANGSVAATGQIEISGTAESAGVISLYIANHLISIPVAIGDDADTINQTIVSIISADAECLVSAKISDNKLLLEAKEKGLNGNKITLKLNKLGELGGESVPTGISINIPDTLSGGVLNPSIADYVHILSNYKAFVVATAFTDVANLNTLQELFNFDTGLWSDAKQIYGHAFGHLNTTLAEAQTLGLSRNDPNMTLTALDGVYNMPYDVAAEVSARAAVEFALDPARPLQTLELTGIDVDTDKVWDNTAINTLLWSGIASLEVNKDNGSVTIDRLITTYQKNGNGEADNSYLDVTTMYTLMEIAYRYKSYYLLNYPRHKLGNDDGKYAPGQPIITPSMMKAIDIQIAKELEYDGLIEDVNGFIERLIVARNEVDRNRLDHVLVPDLMNQLRIISTLLKFKV